MTTTTQPPPLQKAKPLPETTFNRLFALVYAIAILVLFYHHLHTLLFNSKTLLSITLTLLLLVADTVLAFQWTNTTALRLNPIRRQEYPERMEEVVKRSEFPSIDIFICTADPYKEPPIDVVNTALSVLAYDYPPDKLSVYVSDDGGSILTLFAFVEATKFAAHWLPFCRRNRVMERSPQAYFDSSSTYGSSLEEENIKMMYESMKMKVENVLEAGKVIEDYISSNFEQEIFSKWNDNFTGHDHPTIIQGLLDKSLDKDITGQMMPNLIYVSREKRKGIPHHFKAGALNALIRISAIMTNAPIILTLDCDMNSNDPQTPIRMLCHLYDAAIDRSTLGYIQFPQIFKGLNDGDIYAGEYKDLYRLLPMGYDGLLGPIYLGSNCFLLRRVLFGGPSRVEQPEIPEIRPDHVVDKSIKDQSVFELAHRVAGCHYEDRTKWGSKIGIRYGSLSEDYYTGFQVQCQGWKSTFSYPDRPAFVGEAPMRLIDLLNQQKRWSIGLLEIAFSKQIPSIYGIKYLGILMGLGHLIQPFWAFWSIPITIYAFLPQLCLVNQVYIFPKVSEPWFLLYTFLFTGAYGQDCMEFVLGGGTVKKWWNDQRIWHVRGVTCYIFGGIEFGLKRLGISMSGFNVTSKVVDDDQKKRYERGMYEFGVHSPMFVTLTTAALINLVSFTHGVVYVLSGEDFEMLLGQLFVSFYGVVNCWPIYEAMVLRSDSGKLPFRTTIVSMFLALALYVVAALIFK